jgi:hypothetical protein
VLPGNVHDLAAARENVLAVLRPFLDAMPVLADPGYEGAGHGVHVPVKKPAGAKELDIDTRARNALLRSVRCLGERGFALLTHTAAAICYLTSAISVLRASRVRWWYQAESAWWRRRQASQWVAAPGGGGWASSRPVSGTVSGIMPGSAGGSWSGRTGAGARVSVRRRSRAAVTEQIARAAMTSTVCRAIAV